MRERTTSSERSTQAASSAPRSARPPAHLGSPDEVLAARVMRKDLVLLDRDQSASEAIDELVSTSAPIGVVIDELGAPRGVVTLESALHAQAQSDHSSATEVLYSPREGGAREALENGFHVDLTLEDRSVEAVMHPCVMLPHDTSIEAVATALIARRRSFAVVTRGARVEGVITAADLEPHLGTPHEPITLFQEVQGEDDSSSSAKRKASSSHSSSLVPGSKGTIVVVEDDADVSANIVELLRDEGYDVVAAANGREALEVLRVLPSAPGLVLLDLMMPGMNGWEFRHVQVEDRQLAGIPVVVMTAYGHRFNGDDLQQPCALLRKPVSADLLLSTVAHYCHSSS